MNLLRSEWIKLWTVRTTWVMLGIGLAVEGIVIGLIVSLAGVDGLAVDDLLTGLGLLMTLIMVLGVLAITAEFRHGTAGSTFLVTPRRRPVLVAKLGACLLLGLLVGLAFVAVDGLIVLPIYSDRGGVLPATSEIVEVYAGVTVSFGLLAVFGLGIGAIVRNQVGAIVAAIAVLFVVSGLPELLPGSIGEYFPAQALGSLHGHLEGDGNLSQVGGGLVLATWSLALFAVGTLLVGRRDVAE